MKTVNRAISLVLVGTLVSGCATVVHGGSQKVRVVSSPSGAVVRVNLNKIATTTPGVLILNRKETGYVLTFEKEGYNPVEISLRRTVDGWLFGNILLGIYGILFGLAIDFSNGSAYKLTPDEVSIVLGQQAASLKRDRNTLVVFADMEKLPKELREKISRRQVEKI